MRKFIAPLLITALFICSCSTDSGEPVDILVPTDFMGLVHGGTTRSYDGPNVQERYQTLNDIGVTWFLDDFSWNSIQPEDKKDLSPEEWNWDAFDRYIENAKTYNDFKILALLAYDTGWLHGGSSGETIPVLNYLNQYENVTVYNDGCVGRGINHPDEVEAFCKYVKATVGRYKDSVDAWCIWNEPNLTPRFWNNTSSAFYQFSVQVADAIREVDPNAIIVVGALNSIANDEWINGLYRSGATKKADFVAYHPYTPTASTTASNLQGFLDKTPSSFRSKVWITEVGNPTAPNYNYYTEVPEERMPQTIIKTVVLLAEKGAQKVFWYHLADTYRTSGEDYLIDGRNPNNSEDWFGLYRSSEVDPGSTGVRALIPKGKMPEAYKFVAEHIPGKTLRVSGLAGLDLPTTVESYYFEGDDGKRCLVVWNNSISSNIPTVTINLPGTGHKLFDPATAVYEPVPASSTHELTKRDAADEKVLFFTWDAE